MNLKVVMMSGDTSIYTVENTATWLSQLKVQVEASKGILGPNQRFIHEGTNVGMETNLNWYDENIHVLSLIVMSGRDDPLFSSDKTGQTLLRGDFEDEHYRTFTDEQWQEIKEHAQELLEPVLYEMADFIRDNIERQ